MYRFQGRFQSEVLRSSPNSLSNLAYVYEQLLDIVHETLNTNSSI